MDCDKLTDLLATLQISSWQVSFTKKDKAQNIRWLPLIALAGKHPTWWIGIDDKGRWVHDSPDGIVIFTDTEILIMLLPLLEHPYREIYQTLASNLERVGLSQEATSCFPFEKVLVSGLKSQIDYWAALAIKWAEEIPVSSAIAEELLIVSKAKWASQHTRQRAQMLYKQQTGYSSLKNT